MSERSGFQKAADAGMMAKRLADIAKAASAAGVKGAAMTRAARQT